MVLWPVKLNTTRDPGTGQPYQSRFYNLVIVNEVTLTDLIISHLDATAQLGQDHYFDVLIFKEETNIFLVFFLVVNLFNYRVWVNFPATALVHPFLEKHGVFIRFANTVGWDSYFLFPDVYIFITHKFYYA